MSMSIPDRWVYNCGDVSLEGCHAGKTMFDAMTMHDHTTTTEAAAGTSFSFEFVGEVLAIDLVNTEVVVRRRPFDLLAPPGTYVAWWGEAAARYPELAGLLP